MSTENKRINIQYSIDFSELPTEVIRIYQKGFEQFNNMSLPNRDQDNILDFSTVKSIDNLRQEMARLDLILSDVQSIVSSYIEYEVSESNPESTETQIHQAAPPMPDLSNVDLSEMSKFFNGMSTNELQEPDQRSE
jgi:hypothetical protein